MRTICGVSILFLTLVSLYPAAQAADPYRKAHISPAAIRFEESCLLELVNEERQRGAYCGSRYYAPVEPLAWNAKLAKAALRQSRDMSRNDFLDHTGSDGSRLRDRVSDAGYYWGRIAENVCMGYRTPEETVQAWMASEGHCQSIMNPEYLEAGAAVTEGRQGKQYWSIVFGREMQ